jgi:hypothetical protein
MRLGTLIHLLVAMASSHDYDDEQKSDTWRRYTLIRTRGSQEA